MGDEAERRTNAGRRVEVTVPPVRHDGAALAYAVTFHNNATGPGGRGMPLEHSGQASLLAGGPNINFHRIDGASTSVGFYIAHILLWVLCTYLCDLTYLCMCSLGATCATTTGVGIRDEDRRQSTGCLASGW
jgi:hypothetical protein